MPYVFVEIFQITQKSNADFIETLEVSETIKAELKQITPANYTGV